MHILNHNLVCKWSCCCLNSVFLLSRESVALDGIELMSGQMEGLGQIMELLIKRGGLAEKEPNRFSICERS